MPPTRKTHHKSRNGCTQCKKRHVKVNTKPSVRLVKMLADYVDQCDEVQPVCGNCVKRDAPCSLSSNEQSPSNGHEHRDSPASTAEIQQKILSRTEEMELMHFYATDTIESLCHDPKDRYMYTHGIPLLAFQNEYLLDVLLALVCLHRAKIQPLNQKFWVRCAIEYHNRALPTFYKVLGNVNDETCHAAFAFSWITTLVEIAMPHPDVDPIEQLVGLRNYFRGTTMLYLTMIEPLKYGAMNPFFKPKTIKWEYDPVFRKSYHDRITTLYDLIAGSPDEKIYIETIDLLLRLFVDSPFSVTGFSLLVGPDFFQLVTQREPLAVLIYIYCGVLFHNIKEWWCDGLGGRIVNGLTLPEEVLEKHPAWASALLWARQQVNKVTEPDKVLFWRIFVSFVFRDHIIESTDIFRG
ncbi:hypothetical protein E4T44_01491 [Aureobasidium sp. EXF-8845]|nr:hypothetical protein E4T44_01491 [Aureobasidium sp. EXF-8845]KAI4857085.1 hypothetical protein E4T45_01437 [Aureobasidium sp. EXF-8846]